MCFRPHLIRIRKAPFPAQFWCKPGVMSIDPLLTGPMLPPPPPLFAHRLSTQQPGSLGNNWAQLYSSSAPKPSNGSLSHPEKKLKSSMASSALETSSLPNSFTFFPCHAPPCSLQSYRLLHLPNSCNSPSLGPSPGCSLCQGCRHTYGSLTPHFPMTVTTSVGSLVTPLFKTCMYHS